MAMDYVWYMSNGDVLIDAEACDHMKALLVNYQILVDDVSTTLKRCLENNHIVAEDTLPNTVMFTSEQLSQIGIELELLTQRIAAGLEGS